MASMASEPTNRLTLKGLERFETEMKKYRDKGLQCTIGKPGKPLANATIWTAAFVGDRFQVCGQHDGRVAINDVLFEMHVPTVTTDPKATFVILATDEMRLIWHIGNSKAFVVADPQRLKRTPSGTRWEIEKTHAEAR